MLIAELLAQRRKQPLAPVPGMTGRQPPAMISGIDRPQVPDLMPLDVDHRDERATARGGRAPGAGRHDHDPGGTAGFHHAILAAPPARGEPRRGTISPKRQQAIRTGATPLHMACAISRIVGRETVAFQIREDRRLPISLSVVGIPGLRRAHPARSVRRGGQGATPLVAP